MPNRTSFINNYIDLHVSASSFLFSRDLVLAGAVTVISLFWTCNKQIKHKSCCLRDSSLVFTYLLLSGSPWVLDWRLPQAPGDCFVSLWLQQAAPSLRTASHLIHKRRWIQPLPGVLHGSQGAYPSAEWIPLHRRCGDRDWDSNVHLHRNAPGKRIFTGLCLERLIFYFWVMAAEVQLMKKDAVFQESIESVLSNGYPNGHSRSHIQVCVCVFHVS